MATRLEDIREQEATLQTELRKELKDADGNVFHPNLFIEVIKDGIRIWSEDGSSVTLPDAAVKPLKVVLTWLLGTA